jgi:hypothetical protein
MYDHTRNYNYRHFIRQHLFLSHLQAIQQKKERGVIVKKRNLKCILMIVGLEEEKNSFECHCQ